MLLLFPSLLRTKISTIIVITIITTYQNYYFSLYLPSVLLNSSTIIVITTICSLYSTCILLRACLQQLPDYYSVYIFPKHIFLAIQQESFIFGFFVIILISFIINSCLWRFLVIVFWWLSIFLFSNINCWNLKLMNYQIP